jgi:hypothetical protein
LGKFHEPVSWFVSRLPSATTPISASAVTGSETQPTASARIGSQDSPLANVGTRHIQNFQLVANFPLGPRHGPLKNTGQQSYGIRVFGFTQSRADDHRIVPNQLATALSIVDGKHHFKFSRCRDNRHLGSIRLWVIRPLDHCPPGNQIDIPGETTAQVETGTSENIPAPFVWPHRRTTATSVQHPERLHQLHGLTNSAAFQIDHGSRKPPGLAR